MQSKPDVPSSRSKQATVVVVSTLFLLVVPVIVDLLRHTTTLQKRLFAYSAPDTFYYLTVARNLGLHGKSSFDGEHLSNGYHPLWQLITALPYALHLPGANSPWVLAYLLIIAMGLQCTALVLWSRVFQRKNGTLSWFFAFLPAGVFAFLSSPFWLSLSEKSLEEANLGEGAQPVYGSLWTFLNGMETSLVLLSFAWVAWLATREKPLDNPIRFGLALITFTFSRLDHIFFAGIILAGISLGHMRRENTWRARLREPALATLAFAGPLFLYLGLNSYFFGSALPLSGRSKTTLPFISIENFDVTRKYINNVLLAHSIRLDDHWRVMQLVLPLLAALVTPLIVTRIRIRQRQILLSWAHPAPQRSVFLLLTAIGIVILAAYNGLFVYAYSVGHWYFPISCFFMSLLTLHAWERIRLFWSKRRKQAANSPAALRRARFFRFAVPIVTLVFTGTLFYFFHRTTNYHARYAKFAIDSGEEFRQFLKQNNAKIIDSDDGILAWVGEVPAMSGTGLALDLEAALARRSPEGMMPLALARGYEYAGTLVYVDISKLKGKRPKEVVDWMSGTGAFLQLGRLKDYEWRVAFQTPDRDFALVKATNPAANRNSTKSPGNVWSDQPPKVQQAAPKTTKPSAPQP
jgi:hypothetical protein